MTDKQINRWLRRRFSSTGWVLLGYYALINILSLLAMFWEALYQVMKMDRRGPFWFRQLNMDAIAGNAWGYITAIGVLVVILHGWKGPEYWRNEVFRKEKPMKLGAFFAILCLCAGSQMVNSLWVSGLEALYNLSDKSLMPLLETMSGASDTLSMFLYAAILAPIGEEVLFRGFVLRTLRPYGKRFAILGSAFLFGIYHGNLIQTPYAFLAGLLLGYTAAEYSLGWAIGVHMFNNFVLADLMTRLMQLLPENMAQILQMAIFGGFFVISAVLLLTKRREIAGYIRSEWMDRRVLKCFFTSAGVVVMTIVMIGNILAVMP